jgi:hypothetical protein
MLKWRLFLSVSNLVVAAVLFEVGLVQERTMHKNHPDYFHEGFYSYTPPALIVSYSLNAPSLVLSQGAHNFLTRRFNWSERWFPYGKIEYYIAVFAFWWFVGWRADTKGSLRNAPFRLRVVAYLLGAALAIPLVYGGAVLPREEYGTRAIPISMALWGIALLFYFGSELPRRPRED